MLVLMYCDCTNHFNYWKIREYYILLNTNEVLNKKDKYTVRPKLWNTKAHLHTHKLASPSTFTCQTYKLKYVFDLEDWKHWNFSTGLTWQETSLNFCQMLTCIRQACMCQWKSIGSRVWYCFPSKYHSNWTRP